MWIARDGTQNVVHSVSIILEYPVDLLHVWAFLARRNRGQSEIHQLHIGPSFSPWVSSRREDLVATDVWKSQETKKTIWTTNWRRNAKSKNSKESMTDSYEIMSSVSEWLNIIEMKIFVDDGMLLRMKITLTIWPHKNTSTIRANGGFIQISKVLILCHWGIDLFSSKHCLLCNDYNKKQEKNHKSAYLFLEAQTMGGTGFIFYMVGLARFMGDSFSFLKWRRRCTKYWVNGATRYLQYLASFLEKNFHEFNLFCYRLIVYSWRRSTVTDGRCKYNTSNDVFAVWISTRNSRTGQKLSKWLQRQEFNWRHEVQSEIQQYVKCQCVSHHAL